MKDEAFRLDIPITTVTDADREHVIRVLHKRWADGRETAQDALTILQALGLVASQPGRRPGTTRDGRIGGRT